MKLDLSALEAAVAQLEEALRLYDSDTVREFEALRKHMRAAVIQAFEFTYELSVSMTKRYMEQVSADPAEMDRTPFRNLIRMALGQGLLHSGVDSWMIYRKMRGTTSHTYSEQSAAAVFRVAPEFLEEAAYLLHELTSRNELLD